MRAPAWLNKLRHRLARPPRELAMFFASSLAARGLGIVCQLLQVPIAVKVLGAEAFGLWMTLTSITNFVTFADFGVGVGVQNKIAEAFARHDAARARALFGSGFVFLSAVAVGLAAVAVAGASLVDYTAVFRLQETATIAEARQATLAFLLIFCAGFPLGLAQRLAFGRNEAWMYNATQALGSVASLGGVALAARLGGGLTWFVVSGQGALVLGNLVLLVTQLARQGWLWRGWLAWRPPLVHELLGLGAFFGVQQLLSTILFSLPALVVSTQLGAAALTPYSLLHRLYNLFAVIQNAFMLPLWPAYSRARARGEFAWMRRTLRRSLLATTFFSVLPMCVGAVFSREILHLWVGGDVVMPSTALIWLFFAWNAYTFFQQPFVYLLAGVSEVRRTTLYSVLTAITSTVLMFVLAEPLGAPGVLLGLLAGALPFSGLGNVIETRRYLRAHAVPPPAAPASSLSTEDLTPALTSEGSLNAKA